MKILVFCKRVSLVLLAFLIVGGMYFGSQAYYSDYPKIEVEDDAEHPLLISQNSSSVQTFKFSPMREVTSGTCSPCRDEDRPAGRPAGLFSRLDTTHSHANCIHPAQHHIHYWYFQANQKSYPDCTCNWNKNNYHKCVDP